MRCHVTDGVVDDGPKMMLDSWRNVTNLECYSPEELLVMGWFPLWDAQTPVGAGEKLGDPVYTFDGPGQRVVMAHQVEAMTDVEFNSEIDRQILAADAERDQALLTGVLHAGKRWHVDNVFAIHLMAMLQAYDNGIVPANSRQPIRTLDNTIEMLLRSEIVPLAAVVMGRQQQVYGQSWQVKDVLRAKKRA